MGSINRCDVCGAPAQRSVEYRRDWYKVKKDSWNPSFDICPECAESCGLAKAYSNIKEKYEAAWEEIAAQTKDGE